MEIVLALIASLLFALGTVLQQKAGLDDPVPDRGSSGLLLQMARRPVWLAGIAADALGFVAQAIALTIGRLAVVQPLLISSVVFALPLGVRLTGQTVRRIDVAAALVVCTALAAFLVIADPSGGRNDAPLGEWLLAGGACGAVAAALVLAGRASPPARKAALVGLGGRDPLRPQRRPDEDRGRPVRRLRALGRHPLAALRARGGRLRGDDPEPDLAADRGPRARRSRRRWSSTRSRRSCSARRSSRSRCTRPPPARRPRWLALLAALGGLTVLARTQETGAATKPRGRDAGVAHGCGGGRMIPREPRATPSSSASSSRS